MNSIMILDDDEYIQLLLTSILNAEGYSVVNCRSAASASENLRRRPVSLVVVDYMLPDLDGMSWIANERSNGCKTPFLFLSGIACDACMQSRLRNLFQVDLVLRKPVNPQQFIQCVKDLVGESGQDCGTLLESEEENLAAIECGAGFEDGLEPANFSESSAEGDLEELLGDLHLEYLRAVPDLLRELAVAIESGFAVADGEKLTLAIMKAHTFKGTSGSYSLDTIAQLTAEVESALRRHQDSLQTSSLLDFCPY